MSLEASRPGGGTKEIQWGACFMKYTRAYAHIMFCRWIKLDHVLYTVEAQLQNEVFHVYVDVQRHQTCSEHVGWSVCVTHWLESSCVIRVKILHCISGLAGWPVLDGRPWPTDTFFQIRCRLATIKLWRCTTDARFSLHFSRQEEQRHG